MGLAYWVVVMARTPVRNSCPQSLYDVRNFSTMEVLWSAHDALMLPPATSCTTMGTKERWVGEGISFNVPRFETTVHSWISYACPMCSCAEATRLDALEYGYDFKERSRALNHPFHIFSDQINRNWNTNTIKSITNIKRENPKSRIRSTKPRIPNPHKTEAQNRIKSDRKKAENIKEHRSGAKQRKTYVLFCCFHF